MDWPTIIMAAIGGGVGAALGAAVAKPFSSGQSNSSLATILVIIGIVLGGRFGPAALSPVMGTFLRDATGTTAQVEDTIREIEESAFFQAIYDEDPGARERIRSRLIEAYRRGGTKALAREATEIETAYLDRLLPIYIPRARNEDLIEFISVRVATWKAIAERDMHLCYQALFAPSSVDGARLVAAIPDDLGERSFAAVNALFENAADQPVAYDRLAAQQRLQMIATRVIEAAPPELALMLRQGRLAETPEQEAIMVNYAIALFAGILDDPLGADVLRFMLTLNAGQGA